MLKLGHPLRRCGRVADHAAYQAVTAVRGNVLRYWKATTLPYPEPQGELTKSCLNYCGRLD